MEKASSSCLATRLMIAEASRSRMRGSLNWGGEGRGAGKGGSEVHTLGEVYLYCNVEYTGRGMNFRPAEFRFWCGGTNVGILGKGVVLICGRRCVFCAPWERHITWFRYFLQSGSSSLKVNSFLPNAFRLLSTSSGVRPAEMSAPNRLTTSAAVDTAASEARMAHGSTPSNEMEQLMA